MPESVVQPIDGATHYLAFDPALSCGWTILQVAAGRVVSIAVGAIQVDGVDVGTRCNHLKRAIDPLLTPTPACIFIESYHGHARANDDKQRKQSSLFSGELPFWATVLAWLRVKRTGFT